MGSYLELAALPMNAADRRHLTPVFGVIASVLGALLIWLWAGAGREPDWHDHATPPRLPPVGSPIPTPKVSPIEHYRQVWQQPLFSPTRTPNSNVGDKASGNLQLTGVIMLPGLNLAILHDKTSGKDYRVIEGRPVVGRPVLMELHPHSAVIGVSGLHLRLKLIPGPSPDAESISPGGSPRLDTGTHALQVVSMGSSDSPVVLRRAGPYPIKARNIEPNPNPAKAHANERAMRASEAPEHSDDK